MVWKAEKYYNEKYPVMEKSLYHMPCSLWFILTNPYNWFLQAFQHSPESYSVVFCVSYLNEVALTMRS